MPVDFLLVIHGLGFAFFGITPIAVIVLDLSWSLIPLSIALAGFHALMIMGLYWLKKWTWYVEVAVCVIALLWIPLGTLYGPIVLYYSLRQDSREAF